MLRTTRNTHTTALFLDSIDSLVFRVQRHSLFSFRMCREWSGKTKLAWLISIAFVSILKHDVTRGYERRSKGRAGIQQFCAPAGSARVNKHHSWVCEPSAYVSMGSMSSVAEKKKKKKTNNTKWKMRVSDVYFLSILRSDEMEWVAEKCRSRGLRLATNIQVHAIFFCSCISCEKTLTLFFLQKKVSTISIWCDWHCCSWRCPCARFSSDLLLCTAYFTKKKSTFMGTRWKIHYRQMSDISMAE